MVTNLPTNVISKVYQGVAVAREQAPGSHKSRPCDDWPEANQNRSHFSFKPHAPQLNLHLILYLNGKFRRPLRQNITCLLPQACFGVGGVRAKIDTDVIYFHALREGGGFVGIPGPVTADSKVENTKLGLVENPSFLAG